MENTPLLIGIGGAGCNIAEQVHAVVGGRLGRVNAIEDIQPAWPVASTVALPTGRRGIRDTREVGKSAEVERDRLAQLIHGAPQVVLFTGLGGAMGSGATPVIARVAAECGCGVAVFVTLPLALETRAVVVAEKSLAAIRVVCPAINIHDHEVASRDKANASLNMEALLALSVSAAVGYSRGLVEALA
jgi:cell division protein FtsZ